MKVYLKLPEAPETAINVTLVPKAGENIDYGGVRYLVISVVHAVEASKTTLEVVRGNSEEAFRTLKFNHFIRYRTSEIKSYSPPARSRHS
ncbi:MAG: hypothetical protein FJ403_22710 [Verrucomicrobia bacterium]|nr:hypothetical protein [Verrucomicrobiota bacterium]